MSDDPSRPRSARTAFAGSPGSRLDKTTAADGTWPLPDGLARALRRRPSFPELAAGPEVPLADSAASHEPARRAPDASADRARFPRPPRPARPPGLAAPLQQQWKELLDRHDALGELDHFGVLGIPYESGVQHVQRAFAEQVKRFHPDRLPPELDMLRPYAMRIVARLNGAREALSSRPDREAYLRRLGRVAVSPAQAQAQSSRSPAVPRNPRKSGSNARGVAAIEAREERLRSLRARDEAPANGGARLLRALRRS